MTDDEVNGLYLEATGVSLAELHRFARLLETAVRHECARHLENLEIEGSDSYGYLCAEALRSIP